MAQKIKPIRNAELLDRDFGGKLSGTVVHLIRRSLFKTRVLVLLADLND